MARYGLSIEKTTLFRQFQQPFANVYHYKALAGATEDVASLEALVDNLVAKEKAFHATVVNFTRARLWLTGTGSQATNVMKVDKALSGAGAVAPSNSMDRERAFLFRWRAGSNSRGLPVYLRKWYHTVCGMNVLTLPTAVLENTAPLTNAQRDSLEAVIEPIGEIVIAGVGGFRLVAQSGREWTQAVECHPYLEHHQLGDQWR
jgi:hypothetical protein